MKNKLKPKYVIPILTFAILGNPFYQMVSYFCCEILNYSVKIPTNITQIDQLPYFLFLVLIFVIRFLIYALLFHFHGKIKPFTDLALFFKIFVQRHLYQFIGLFTLLVWLLELEMNIVGLLVAPISLLLGSIVSGITIFRITKIPKIWLELKAERD